MTLDPVERFLGVDRFADPLRLLGLAPDRCDALAVETALHRLLEQIFAHPQGRSADADVVRQALREAAAALKDPQRRAEILASVAGTARQPVRFGAAEPARAQTARRIPISTVPIVLTAFDRQVLAALVAGGGWNAAARSRIVALAGTYGVTVDGLIKVIHGLSEYAKSGGQRLGLEQITAGGQRLAPMPGSASSSQAAQEWVNRVAPELRGEGGAWATAKLAALSVLVVLLIGVVIVGALLRGQPSPPPDIPAPGAAVSVERARPVPPPRVPAAESRGEGPAAPARFDTFPTFKGSDRPAAAVEALDHSAHLPQEIAALSRKLLISSDPSDQVFREWRDAVQTASSCWVLLDEPALSAIDKEVIELMYAASTAPAVSDRVLAAMTPPPARLGEPIDVWRGAWMCGMLGRAASRSDLSPGMVERAASQLAVALGAELPPDTSAFDGGAGAWLRTIISPLVGLAGPEERSADFWELWFAAQSRLPAGERLSAAIMDAIKLLLASPIDLSRPSVSLNLLGRLVRTADFSGSPLVRQRMESMFIGPDGADNRVTAADLWILTSLISQSDQRRWFGSDLVLPPDASDSHRRRKWARIADAWPATLAVGENTGVGEGHRQVVDPQAAARWSALLERCLAELRRRDSAGLMGQLMDACWLNEAAARLASGQMPSAQIVMDRLTQNLDRIALGNEIAIAGAPDAGAGPGQTIGADGQWAAAPQEPGSSADARMQQLETLRRSAGTDLGPIDSQALVREAYRGRTPELRSLAQTIITAQFSRGPNIALAMLDQLADAPINAPLSEAISRVTGRVLPGVRSSGWPLESRLALVERAMTLRNWPASAIDLTEHEIAVSLDNQLAALRGEDAVSPPDARPQDASRKLAEAWRTAMERVTTDAPTPAPLPVLASRHRTRAGLAGGPIEQLVADRLAVLDLLTYETISRQPAQRGSATAMLGESSRRRGAMTHVLDQAVEVELTIGRIWRLRFTPDPAARAHAEQRP